MSDKLPTNLVEATKYFSSPERCIEFVAALRWPDGVTCPHCQSKNVGLLATRLIWKCKEKPCRKQFSAKTGSIMEDSAIPLEKWLIAIWLIASAKNGISSYELSRLLGITQKSAWFVLHRIRLAMETKSFEKKLQGEVEADETWIGGKSQNMHLWRRAVNGPYNNMNKTIVMGLLERHGDVRTKIVENTGAKSLKPVIHSHVEPGSKVYTDEGMGYRGLKGFQHLFVNHCEAYVSGRVHTNGLENYWSLFKRCVHGTWVSPSPWQLRRYLAEQAFRFNSRKMKDGERFQMLVGRLAGKRLTYARLIDRPTKGGSKSAT